MQQILYSRNDRNVFLLFISIILLATRVGAMSSYPSISELQLSLVIPDPLISFGGNPVKNHKQWLTKRRPELKELFQHYEYGYFPPPAKIRAKVEHVDKIFYGSKATLKLVTISFGPEEAPDIHLMLVVPNQRKKPAPVFLGMNFCGNHALVTDTNVPIPTGRMNDKYPGVVKNRATEKGRGTQIDVWAIEQSIDRGYAVATFFNGEVDPDISDFSDGVHPFFHSKRTHSDQSQEYRKISSPSQRGPHDWGTIAAWAWGLHRAVDYLEKDRDIDKKRIAVVGHSRLGKTALLAAAFDERIALAIPHQAGCGGTAPSRSTVGESVKRINDHFPHWFCEEFKKFNEEPERLPFDQHCLIALCAPRPVLLSNAIEDTWANPEGQFEMLKAADPVYKLLGSEGLTTREMPATERLIDSTLGYYIRPGKHSMTKEDWKIFLDFADKHFGQ